MDVNNVSQMVCGNEMEENSGFGRREDTTHIEWWQQGVDDLRRRYERGSGVC